MKKKQFNILIKEKFKNINLIAVSNREPVVHEYSGKKIISHRSVGGLTIALEPIMRNLNGTWIAYGGGSADKAAIDKNNKIKLPPDEESYSLKRLFLTKTEIDGYYYGYSNSVLWPLSHIVYKQPEFNSEYFEIYKKVNKKFADSVIEEIKLMKDENGKDDADNIIWLQDYHLSLAAKYIKEYDESLKIGIFWHIPWPNPEVFSICPEKKELLEGLLSNDLIGFHILYHCQNFLKACEWELEAQVNWADYLVTYKGHTTKINPFPISIDAKSLYDFSKDMNINSDDFNNLNELIELPHQFLALSVDRMDYTKGIKEKLMAIDLFLEKYPAFIGKFIFLQLGVPSRMHIKAYKEYYDEINSLAEQINWKYKNDDWYPIILFLKQLDLQSYIYFYKIADIVIVSPLHDGMNLVAKEFIMSNTDYKGMLILSKFTGSSKELSDAILINPYNIECFADSINNALKLDAEEKKKRVSKMQNIIFDSDIYDWAYNFLSKLKTI